MRLAVAARRVEGLSGAVRIVLEQARAAARAGWEVHVFAERLDEAAVRAAGAVPRLVPRWPWGSWLKRRLFAAAAGRLARGFDLVHGHGDLLAQDLLSLHNCVHAAHEAVRGAPLPEGDAVGRLHALQLREGRYRLLAANSRLMRDDLVRRFGADPARIAVVRPGHDPARFSPAGRSRGAALRRELGVGAEAPLFGLVTSGDFAKRGLGAFLRAFALARRELPAARALVAGKEARPGPWRRLAGELGLDSAVSWLAPRPDVETLYHALDAYVHPAPWEEFGMSVLEAMACGVPVAVGARVGAAELLEGESREFVLEDLSPECLAAAMLRLGRDAPRRRRLGALAATAAAPCDWEASAGETLALYERLLAGKR